jgi:tetratricopeptide (TPR) repeat protein
VLERQDGPAAARERARIAVWLATTRQRQRRPDDAIGWCRRAVAEAERADDARHALGHAYIILDWAYQALGRPDEATYLPLALEIYEELGDLEWISIVLNNMAGRAYEEGRWNNCLELARRALEAKETIGDRWSAALRVFKASRAPGFTAHAQSLLGRIAARRGGRLDEARSLLEEARALHLEADQPTEALRTDAAIAECLVLQGDAQSALALVESTLARSAETEGLAVLGSELERLRGCALLQLGRFDEARRALEEALETTRRQGADFAIKSADYEAAATLDALVRLGEVIGEPSLAELSAERDVILAVLGIVALPELPLGSAA